MNISKVEVIIYDEDKKPMAVTRWAKGKVSYDKARRLLYASADELSSLLLSSREDTTPPTKELFDGADD